jgi:dihydrodipicolinate synthase/N-acetylneuraminate lyase
MKLSALNTVNIVDALELGVKQIPTLVGMKFSSSDLITFSHIATRVKNFKIFCGFEDVSAHKLQYALLLLYPLKKQNHTFF